MPDLEADVVIIGSGPGGAGCAWRLCSRGVRVLLLEAGPRFDPATDYPQTADDWERHDFPEKPGSRQRHSFAEMQPLNKCVLKTLRSWNQVSGPLNRTGRRHGWKYHHVRGVGGSTLHYTGEAHRLNPKSMHLRSEYGVGADWPIDYGTLDPYYLIAERFIGVAGEEDPRHPRSAPYPLPAHAASHASRLLVAATKAAGFQWHANPLAVLSRPHGERPPCNYCAACNRGCPRRDKGSADVTFIAAALATGRLDLRPNTEVMHLENGDNDEVKRVVARQRDGNRLSITARTFVLACGAVETPRLLLNSADARSPHGLANDSGQVGRNFLETLSWSSTGIHAANLGSHRGLPRDVICWDYNDPDAIPGVVGGCRFGPATAETGFGGPIAYAKRSVPGWGRDHKVRMRQEFGHLLTLSAIGESLPNEGTFVDLHPEARDRNGYPLARIHSHLDDMAIRRLQFMARTCRELLELAGAGELREEYGSYDFFSSTHVFGTARMGKDPASSVVDPWCRSHRWKNLYITDASVFPSSGGGESPSLTISALAIRAADFIRKQLMV